MPKHTLVSWRIDYIWLIVFTFHGHLLAPGERWCSAYCNKNESINSFISSSKAHRHIHKHKHARVHDTHNSDGNTQKNNIAPSTNKTTCNSWNYNVSIISLATVSTWEADRSLNVWNCAFSSKQNDDADDNDDDDDDEKDTNTYCRHCSNSSSSECSWIQSTWNGKIWAWTEQW